MTFDDAFGSVLDLAYPILSELDVPGTVFAPTVFPDEDRALAWSGSVAGARPGVSHAERTQEVEPDRQLPARFARAREQGE